ncbi:hypothetical protein [Rossellomorea sp. y25]|uniref:hypothetical protein n=1 Tax=Rossellomorea sp. y25 TaxID=3118174 RepID=UPI0030E387A7
MQKLRILIIKKLIGRMPVIMNVTLKLDDHVLGASPNGIFEKCNITYTDRLMKGGAAGAEVKNRNAQ